MSTLERAIAIAAEAHEGQLDKGGAPYVLHLARVMVEMDSPTERIVAVLHDLVEDTAWKFEQLRAEGFSELVVSAVDSLTRRGSEDYMTFVRRAARHDVARKVKIADLRDNMDPTRLSEPTEKDRERLQRYQLALSYLEQYPNLPDINPGLDRTKETEGFR